MKRFIVPIICGLTTLFLILSIVFHRSANDVKLQHLQNQLAKAVVHLAQTKTSSVNADQFIGIIRKKFGPELRSLTENQQAKLFDCVDHFYLCYSTGNFVDYKRFRLLQPYTVSKGIISFVKNQPALNSASLNSDEDILHIAWDYFNGTNKVSQIDQENIHLSVVTKSDLGIELRTASDAKNWSGIHTATCLEGTVLYQPTLTELLQEKKQIQYLTLEINARFDGNTNGPALPLVLQAYWDPTRENWMPNCLCFWIHISQYRTFF